MPREILSWDNGAGKHCGAGAEQGSCEYERLSEVF